MHLLLLREDYRYGLLRGRYMVLLYACCLLRVLTRCCLLLTAVLRAAWCVPIQRRVTTAVFHYCRSPLLPFSTATSETALQVRSKQRGGKTAYGRDGPSRPWKPV